MIVNINITHKDKIWNHYDKEVPMYAVVDDERNVIEIASEQDRIESVGLTRTVWVSKSQVKKLNQFPRPPMTAKVEGHKIRIYEH